MIHRGKHGDITWSYCRAPETKGSLQRTRRKRHGLTICGYNNAIHANTILGPSHWHLRRSVGPESYYLATQYRMEQETGTTSADKDANLVFQTETQLKCKNCRRMGHTEPKCWAKGGGQEGQYPDWYEGKKDAHTSDTVKPVTDMPIVWSHRSASQLDIWFADSAATVHVSPIWEDFTTYLEYDKCQDIKTFGKNTVKGISEGDILAEINF